MAAPPSAKAGITPSRGRVPLRVAHAAQVAAPQRRTLHTSAAARGSYTGSPARSACSQAPIRESSTVSTEVSRRIACATISKGGTGSGAGWRLAHQAEANARMISKRGWPSRATRRSTTAAPATDAAMNPCQVATGAVASPQPTRAAKTTIKSARLLSKPLTRSATASPTPESTSRSSATTQRVRRSRCQFGLRTSLLIGAPSRDPPIGRPFAFRVNGGVRSWWRRVHRGG